MSEITMDDAVLAGDNTLHGAIDYWQNKCQHQQSRIDDLEAQLAIAVDALEYYIERNLLRKPSHALNNYRKKVRDENSKNRRGNY